MRHETQTRHKHPPQTTLKYIGRLKCIEDERYRQGSAANATGWFAGILGSYFWRRVTQDVLPSLNRTLMVWATDDLSNLDPQNVPDGTVFNMYAPQCCSTPISHPKLHRLLS